jgi:transposase
MAYESAWGGCALVVADRWFASSKIHHECGGYHADLKLADRRWVCPRCGGLVDHNADAARNIRDWTGPVTDRDVQNPTPSWGKEPRTGGARKGATQMRAELVTVG